MNGLMGAQEIGKMASRDARPGKIYAAMIAVMKAVGPISKDRKNTQQNYAFRGIDDIYNHIQGILAENGVFSLPTILDEKHEERSSNSGGKIYVRLYKVRYDFYADDGSSVAAVVAGEGMDSGDKASNKALSAADKYALVQAFKIPTAEIKDSEADDRTRSTAEAALDRPSPQWVEAVDAFKTIGKTERDALNYVKRADWRGVTPQDFEKLEAWFLELKKDRTA